MDETTAETETSRKSRTAPRNETLEAQVAQLQADIRSISESLARLGADKLEVQVDGQIDRPEGHFGRAERVRRR